jgi:hypothetical protein
MASRLAANGVSRELKRPVKIRSAAPTNEMRTLKAFPRELSEASP